MSKAHGKGKALDINGGGTSTLNRYKHDYLANVSEGLPVREWKPYHEPEALRRNIERCKELTAWPSRFG